MKARDSWSGLRVGVLGLGRSGRAATRLLARAGARVYASDAADTADLRVHAQELQQPGVELELGRHDERALAACDLLVVSPGIPPSAAVFRSEAVRSRPIISELELAFRFLAAPLIAVTGTNGKTTTTAWIGWMLERAGLRVGVGGNIGLALSEIASKSEVEYEWIVAEVSSFQLANIERFKPRIGVLLNLCPDHLDRYQDVERYYADKARLFDNADRDSRWVLNGEDAGVLAMAAGKSGEARYFRVASSLDPGETGAYLKSTGMLALRRDGEEAELLHRSELKLLGSHNVANALAVIVVGTYVQAPIPALQDCLRSFKPLPHRLQPIAERDGVLWVNDSKATNVASTRVALLAMERPVVLLLGGRPKGQSFVSLLPAIEGRVKTVIVYGEAAAQVESELAKFVPVIKESNSLEHVVQRARQVARAGDAVLLAPACASFDMFRDYEERGETFIKLVQGGVT